MSIWSEDKAACGIGISVNIDGKNTRNIVFDILEKLGKLEYRSGYNPATQENDGAGIRFYGLPTKFFQKKITAGDFGDNAKSATIEQGCYGIGQYFMPQDANEITAAQNLIAEEISALGLEILGWRSVDKNTNPDVLSTSSLQKKPTLMQAIIVPSSTQIKTDLESSLLKLSQNIINSAAEKNQHITIVSQSSENIIFKGMIPSSKLKDFFLDLHDEDFTAKAVQVHSRFATNTNPMWRNAQPTANFIAHNGELNSAGSNAVDMVQRGIGAKPDSKLSDSIQFDRDILNIVAGGIPLEEAITLLMPPMAKEGDTHYPAHIKDMLDYFALIRTGYNGPAFMVAGQGDNFIAKLDSVGLRPSRYVIMHDKNGVRQFHAYSDDDFGFDKTANREVSGHLDPGGIIMLHDGKLLNNFEVLEKIHNTRLNILKEKSGNADLTFRTLVDNHLHKLDDLEVTPRTSDENTIPKTLNEKLSLSYWDQELEKNGLRYLVLNGKEQTGAMGDDTPQLERGHISQYFHQLFAQVSSPPLDSIKEVDSFSLKTYLGANLSANITQKQLEISSPILCEDELHKIANNNKVPVKNLSILFPSDSENATTALTQSIAKLCAEAEDFARSTGGILILSDRDVKKGAMSIPDVIALRAVKKHLEDKELANNVSLAVDSYQITDTHQASLLLGMGANAVYPRAAYEKIRDYAANDSEFQKPEYKKELHEHFKFFHKSMEFGLLKNMGKVGITDINNYINGRMFASLGLNLQDGKNDLQSLAHIFDGVPNVLTGHKIDKMVEFALARQSKASNSPILPMIGHFRPEHEGVKHGFGAEVVTAFTAWMNAEKARDLHYSFEKEYAKKHGNTEALSGSAFAMESGFIAPDIDVATPYLPENFQNFKPSESFRAFVKKVNDFQAENPTSIYDMFALKKPAVNKNLAQNDNNNLVQSQAEIRAMFFTGSISQGAITTGDPRIPGHIKAHETILRGANAIGMNSSAGEGGEHPKNLEERAQTARSKQVASGRFGISAKQIMNAEEIEIKVAQGAKPGEGGQLPGEKLTIRLAAQRGAIPNVELISPPPHHDIYSIEDLEELIYDIKSTNPAVKVAVKIVSSYGIGTIAAGIAKAGADVINVASASGGTGAAMQTSIHNAGLPGEIGLSEVDNKLREAGLRDKVELKTSGGLKTPADVIKAAIFGADKFEFGTIGMMTAGCVMQRTCYTSCEPGVAMNPEKFKGRSVDTMRYFMNIAAGVQELLKEMGLTKLEELRGRFDLLEPASAKTSDDITYHGIDKLLERTKNLPTPAEVFALDNEKLKRKDDALILQIDESLKKYKTQTNVTNIIMVNTILEAEDRSFGARIAGKFYKQLEDSTDRIIINTAGNAGQSYGFTLAKGMHLSHTGPVQDGAGKSMTGGMLAVKTPVSENYDATKNTIAGNALFYGASGGEGFINGKVGHRFGVLLKGASIVCEGAGEYACEYMTSGTAMILGESGAGLGNGSSGGTLITYDKNFARNGEVSKSLVKADSEVARDYENVIRDLLEKHLLHTGSIQAKQILENFEHEKQYFSVYTPVLLEKINDVGKLRDVLDSYLLRMANISPGMQVWLNQQPQKIFDTLYKTRSKNAIAEISSGKLSADEIKNKQIELARHKEMSENLLQLISTDMYSGLINEQTIAVLKDTISNFGKEIESISIKKSFSTNAENILVDKSKTWAEMLKKNSPVAVQRDVKERLSGIDGKTDYEMLDAIVAIKEYAEKIKDDAGNCSGCKSQSCAGVGSDSGCPSEKPINAINGKLKELGAINKKQPLTIQQWRTLREAFELQALRTPFFAFTGAACPAPCESSCTESISGTKNPVAIRNIEWNLYTVGKSMGWFEKEPKKFTAEEKEHLFNGDIAAQQYRNMLEMFEPAFSKDASKYSLEEVIIVGSGPAGMEIAHRALKDGKKVTMYEQSEKAGGLLMDGIPHHKFEKTHVDYAFAQLKVMGLTLHLNSQVNYDKEKQSFHVGGNQIFSTGDKQRKIVLCTGAGHPRKLSPKLTTKLSDTSHIVQAVDYLKAANDVAYELQKYPESERNEVADRLIREKFGAFDPRGKRILLVGGGDTAQDAIRWSSRYLNQGGGKLWPLVRGPEKSELRGLLDSYPKMAEAATIENMKRDEEIAYIDSHAEHLVDIVEIAPGEKSNMLVKVEHSQYVNYAALTKDKALKTMFDQMERSSKKTERDTSKGTNGFSEFAADIVLLAMGFEGRKSNQFIKDTEHWPNVFVAGDAREDQKLIIVGAQASAVHTYKEMTGEKQVEQLSKQDITDASKGCNTCGSCPASGGCSFENNVKELNELKSKDNFSEIIEGNSIENNGLNISARIAG